MAILEERYMDFSRRVHSKAAAERIPVHLDFDITYRCNLNCRHCYCNLPADDQSARKTELALPEIERILTDARDLGALWILLTGGEPLLRPDFKDIFLLARGLGLIPVLFTNGTLVTDEWAEFFSKHRPFKIEITLYGPNAGVYERVTRTPGSFERCMNGVRLLQDAGLDPTCKMMVMRSNVDSLPEVKELVRDMGLNRFRFDSLVHPRYSDLPAPPGACSLKERLSPEEVLRLDREDDRRRSDMEDSCSRLFGRIAPSQTSSLLCQAGKSMLSMAPDGTVRPCSMLRFVGSSASEMGLRRAAEQSLTDANKVSSTVEKCHSCELIAICGQCAGWGWLEHRAADARVAHLCELAHARHKAFGDAGRRLVERT